LPDSLVRRNRRRSSVLSNTIGASADAANDDGFDNSTTREPPRTLDWVGDGNTDDKAVSQGTDEILNKPARDRGSKASSMGIGGTKKYVAKTSRRASAILSKEDVNMHAKNVKLEAFDSTAVGSIGIIPSKRRSFMRVPSKVRARRGSLSDMLAFTRQSLLQAGTDDSDSTLLSRKKTSGGPVSVNKGQGWIPTSDLPTLSDQARSLLPAHSDEPISVSKSHELIPSSSLPTLSDPARSRLPMLEHGHTSEHRFFGDFNRNSMPTGSPLDHDSFPTKSSIGPTREHAQADQDLRHLKDLREDIFSSSELIGDRAHYCVSYYDCLVGSQLVDWLQDNNKAATRAEAIAIGRQLSRVGLKHCSNLRKEFEDSKAAFYRFMESGSDDESFGDEEDEEFEDLPMQEVRLESVQAITFCEVLELTQKDFLHVMHKEYEYMRDDVEEHEDEVRKEEQMEKSIRSAKERSNVRDSLVRMTTKRTPDNQYTTITETKPVEEIAHQETETFEYGLHKNHEVSDHTKNRVGIAFLRMYREASRHQRILDRQRRKTAKYLHIAYMRIEGWSGRNFAPGATLRLLWETLVNLCVLWTILLLPFRLSFLTVPLPSTGELASWIIADILVDALLAVDFMLNCTIFIFRASHSEVVPEARASRIFQHYRETFLYHDLFASLPIDWLSCAFVPYGSVTFILLRFVRCMKAKHSYESFTGLMGILRARISLYVYFLVRTLLMVVLILSVNHYLGCAWHWIAITESTTYGRYTWLNQDLTMQQMNSYDAATLTVLSVTAPISYRYIRSIYWSFVLVTTVGYGDIRAITNAEGSFAIFACFWGLFYYWCLGYIASIARDGDGQLEEQKTHTDQLSRYSRAQNLPYDLFQHVREYYRIMWLQQGGVKYTDISDHHELSADMQQEIRLVVNKPNLTVLQKIPLFAPLSESSLQMVCSCFTQQFYLGDAYLIRKGDIVEEMVILNSGDAEVLEYSGIDDAKPKRHGLLAKGAHFGALEFLFRLKVAYDVRTLNNCEVSLLHRDQVNAILDLLSDFEFRSFKAKARKLKDEFFDEVRGVVAVPMPQMSTRDSEVGSKEALPRMLSMATRRQFSSVVSQAMRSSLIITDESALGEQFGEQHIEGVELRRIAWCVLNIFLVWYSLLSIPLRVAFFDPPRILLWQSESPSLIWFWVVLDVLADLATLMDMTLTAKFFHARLPNGEWCTSRRKLWTFYKQEHLIKDVITMVPIDLIVLIFYSGGTWSNFFFLYSLCRIPRLYRLRMLYSNFEYIARIAQEKSARINPRVVDLAWLFIIILSVAHVFTCAFYMASRAYPPGHSFSLCFPA
jgi:CRP-like cAMP-binding protein